MSRRESGELIEHIVGRADFCGVPIEVDRGVFVPRARAEPLASMAAAEVARRGDGARVLDLGCGSGAVAATVKRAVPGAYVIATDASPAAVETARRNGRRFGFDVYRGDWFAGLPKHLARRLEVIVAYLPHTPDRALVTLPRDRVDGEGLHSFAGGPDGLDHLRDVLRALPGWATRDGVFLTLVAPAQADGATAAAERAGWAWSATAADDDVVIALTRPGLA